MRRNNFTLFFIGCLILFCSIQAVADDCFLLSGPNQDLPPGENCIPIRVSGLAEHNQLEFNIHWSGLAHLDEIENLHPNLQSVVLIDSSELDDNVLGFALSAVSTINIPDNSILFEICIDRPAFTEEVSTLSFSGDSPRTPTRVYQGEQRGLHHTDGTIRLSGGTSNISIESACVDYTHCAPLTLAIDVDITGGTTPYTFEWIGPGSFHSTSEDIAGSNLLEGDYTFTVTDLQGTSRVAVFTIVKPQVVPQSYYLDPINCFGDSTGAITFSPLDTSLHLNFQWSHGADSSHVEGLPIGTYSVTVSDERACTWVKEFVLYQPSEIGCNNPAFYCAGPGLANGDIDLNLSGGIAPYECTWSTGYTGNEDYLSDVAAGIYSVTVTDLAGCSKIINDLEVTEGANFELVDSVGLCLGDSVDLFVNIPAGAAITYLCPAEGISCNPCTPPFKITPLSSAIYEIRMIEMGPCVYKELAEVVVDEQCVWPGDTDTSKVVNHFDLLNIGLAHGATGHLRPNASLTWRPEPSKDWQQKTPISFVDYKHIDTDGNGIIEDIDTLAIAQNWGEMHNFRGEDRPEYNADGVPLYVEVDTLEEGETYELRVLLGEAANPALNVYGLAFSLYYDPDIILDGSAYLTTLNSWLGVPDELLLMQRVDDANGQLDVAFTRRDGISVDGSGQIASFNITIEDDIFFKNGGGTKQFLHQTKAPFEIRNVKVIDQREGEIDTDPIDTQATLEKVSTRTTDHWLAQQIAVYPNPAQREVVLRSETVALEQVALYSAAGERLAEWLPEGRQSRIALEGFAEGVYWLEINTGAGVLMERLVILR